MKWASIFLTAFILAFAAPLFAEESKSDKDAKDNADKAQAELDGETASAPEKDAKKDEKKEEEKKEEKKEEQPSAQPAPKVDVKADEEKKEEEGDEGDAEAKEKAKRKYSLGLSQSGSHNLAKERKSFSYGLGLSAGAKVPGEINLGLSGGLSYSLDYDRTQINPDGTTNDADAYLVDGTPLSFTASRAFKVPGGISITPNLKLGCSITSKYEWQQRKVYGGVIGGLLISRSFKLAKNFSLKIDLVGGYSYNYSENDAEFDKNTNDLLYYYFGSHSFNDGISATFMYKDFSLGFVFGQSWAASYNSSKIEDVNGAKYDEYRLMHTYVVNGGYSYKDFSFGLSAATQGKYNKYGNYGKDELKPFEPAYTVISFELGYNYSF